jgi:hypothetical protein
LKFIIPQPEFPDLATIYKYFSTGRTYPHTPVQELQRVTMDYYGIPQMDVTSDCLVDAKVLEPGKEGTESQKE